MGNFHAGCRMGCAYAGNGNGCHVIGKALSDFGNFFKGFALCCSSTGNFIQRNAANQTAAVIRIGARCVGNVFLGNNFGYFNAEFFNLFHSQVAGKHIAGMV